MTFCTKIEKTNLEPGPVLISKHIGVRWDDTVIAALLDSYLYMALFMFFSLLNQALGLIDDIDAGSSLDI